MSPTTEADKKFQIRRQGRRLGPFSRMQIDRMIARQQLGVKDEISPAGNNQWQRIDKWQQEQQKTRHTEQASHDSVAENSSAEAVIDASPSPASAPPEDTETGEWYVADDGKRQGPINEHDLGRWISERRIDAQTLVWRSGMQDWKPAHEVLPAALLIPSTTSPNNSAPNFSSTYATTDPDDARYALRDLSSRRFFWLLIVCVITYIFAAESFALGLFQVYTAVATRRLESSGLIAIWAVSALLFSGLLLMMAIEMTKLLSKSRRRGEAEDSVAVARHEHRLWMFAGLSAAFIIANQFVFAIFLLITIAQTT
ncbi:MAG: DUF4339 domain-containing protein [Rhodopirellula sp. JB044]|uniref:DUF4339 domain-containing protein n=1 Tax=Rhodopirellula sp. JB044 TaxID=3342844 RepID=UPI00370CF917